MLTKNQNDENTDAIAIIKGGINNNHFINLVPDDDTAVLKIHNLYDHISDNDLKQYKKYMSLKDKMKIKRAFEYDIEPDEDVSELYNQLKPTVEKSYKNHIRIHDGTLQPIPLMKSGQIDKLFICGMSGVGKSTYICNYAIQYKKLFPNNKIFMISKLTDDESIDPYVELLRIKVDDDILDINFDDDIKEMNNSLVIIDDIDTISNKKIYEKVKNIRDSILEVGRHHNIYCCCVSHQILNYKNTRALILESNKIVIFPKSSGIYQNKRFLKEYMGYNKNTINLIMNDIKSRWVQIAKTYPNTIIGEHDAYIV